jgi:aryl-alcohol dehydrogenase-like predicted oxidoreductase
MANLVLISGFASPEGTRRYAARFAQKAAAGHFRDRRGLAFSSIGFGTYLGDPNVETDSAYTEAAVVAVEGGINVLDTAINYRLQRSERSLAVAFDRLFSSGFGREELIICTKAGFLTPDGEISDDPSRYFQDEFMAKGIFNSEDIAAGCHCMTPRYLEDQLERSRQNLGLECIDIFYLHNPETQLTAVPREEFNRRVVDAFRFAESAVAARKIRAYGMATWNAFRNEVRSPDYLSLEETVKLARLAGGAEHHFQFVQLPFNLAMPEALVRANQSVQGKTLSMVQAARELHITLVASASLLQSHLAGKVPALIHEVFAIQNDTECALQFTRSAPGITTALVGTKRVDHVRANLRLVGVLPATQEQFRNLFTAPR